MSQKLTQREQDEINTIEADIRAEENNLAILKANANKVQIPISEKKINHLKHRLSPLKARQTNQQNEAHQEAKRIDKQKQAERDDKQEEINSNRRNILTYLKNGATMKQLLESEYTRDDILKVLIDNDYSLEQIKSFGFNEGQILNVLIVRKTPLNKIFNSRFKFTYGYLKKNIDKSDKQKYDLFNDFSKSIEEPGKCVKDGAFGMIGSKALCYYDSSAQKYISKGGRRRRSHRNQYRRSRKISKK